ncbi:TPA: response regulator [Candidatus Poribacteria bacterium]|nr:response regulator [Candidatus Poribacteria bacterium]
MDDKKIKILVADNDPSFLYAFEFIFGEDYEIVKVQDGFSARVMTEKEIFDLIILDVMMPPTGFNEGFEICKYVKSNPMTKNIPVIIMTNRSEQDRSKAIEAGAEAYFTKPFNQNELKKTIEHLLSQSKG